MGGALTSPVDTAASICCGWKGLTTQARAPASRPRRFFSPGGLGGEHDHRVNCSSGSSWTSRTKAMPSMLGMFHVGDDEMNLLAAELAKGVAGRRRPRSPGSRRPLSDRSPPGAARRSRRRSAMVLDMGSTPPKEGDRPPAGARSRRRGGRVVRGWCALERGDPGGDAIGAGSRPPARRASPSATWRRGAPCRCAPPENLADAVLELELHQHRPRCGTAPRCCLEARAACAMALPTWSKRADHAADRRPESRTRIGVAAGHVLGCCERLGHRGVGALDLGADTLAGGAGEVGFAPRRRPPRSRAPPCRRGRP